MLDSDDLPRSNEVAGVEVGSVAYIVCDAIGLDTSDYTFRYVAAWSDGDVEKIKNTGERVIRCARSILECVGGDGRGAESQVAGMPVA